MRLVDLWHTITGHPPHIQSRDRRCTPRDETTAEEVARYYEQLRAAQSQLEAARLKRLRIEAEGQAMGHGYEPHRRADTG